MPAGARGSARFSGVQRWQRQDEQLSSQEYEFLHAWRELIDKVGGDGGQDRVARRLKWSTSTVSRDYAGKTLPKDERLKQLSDYLGLSGNKRVELSILLQRARDSRQDRKTSPAAPTPTSTLVPDAAGSPRAQAAASTMIQEQPEDHHEGVVPPGTGVARPERNRRPSRTRLLAAVVLAAAVTAAPLVWHLRDGTQVAGVRGTYPGEGLQTVAIPVKSLTPALAAAFHQNRTTGTATVTGYEFRNAEADGLCLTAADTGPTAGENHDRVEIAACDLTASQIWIPEQWETNGSTFTHLVNDKYQSMCLNADNLGGLGDGQRAQLWNCYYPANNESWDFGDWYRNVQSGVRSYPVCLHTDRLCLDADKYDFGDGDQVNIWTQYPAANQFWS